MQADHNLLYSHPKMFIVQRWPYSIEIGRLQIDLALSKQCFWQSQNSHQLLKLDFWMTILDHWTLFSSFPFNFFCLSSRFFLNCVIFIKKKIFFQHPRLIRHKSMQVQQFYEKSPASYLHGSGCFLFFLFFIFYFLFFIELLVMATVIEFELLNGERGNRTMFHVH